MPQLKSFSAYAPMPNLGSATVGGMNIAQRAQEATQQIQLQQQKIQADMVQANMEAQAKAQALQSQTLRDEQELKVKQQYQETMLSLKQRDLAQAQEVIQMKTEEAASKFAAQQAYQSESEKLISGGMEPEKAYSLTALKLGPQLGIPGSAYSAGRQSSATAPPGPEIGSFMPVPGLDPEKFGQFASGPKSRQLVKLPDSMAAEVDEDSGYMKLGNKIVPQREPLSVVNLRKDISRLEKDQTADKLGRLYADKLDRGKELKPNETKRQKEYQSRADEIAALRKKVQGAPADSRKSKPKFEDGARIRNKKNGKLYEVVDGEPVPVDEEE